MSDRRPTIRDVALEAGVSLKTVSRVLNREPAVAPETVERVRHAVTRLGYRRNEAAASIRRRRQTTLSVGVVIEDVANPFYAAVIDAVETVVRRRHYLLLVGSSAGAPARETELIQAFCGRRVEGLIVVPTGADHSFLAAEIAAGTAVVFIDRPGLNLETDVVVVANAKGARRGVAHLVEHGHRRVAFIGDDAGKFTTAQRCRGYHDALADAGVAVDHELVRLDVRTAAAAEIVTAELLGLADPPTALFTANNRLTIGALRAARDADAHVALVGFDDFELADLLQPPVTVVAQDAAAIGRTAAELLLRRIDGDHRPAQEITLGTSLVVRGSGEISPSNVHR